MLSMIVPRASLAARVSVQIGSRSVVSQSHIVTPSIQHRYFSATSQRGEEANDSSVSDFIEKIKQSPKTKDSVQSFLKLMEQKGLNVAGGDKPTVAQIAKLALDSDVRAKTSEVMQALKDVGISVSPMQWSDILGKMGASSKDGGK